MPKTTPTDEPTLSEVTYEANLGRRDQIVEEAKERKENKRRTLRHLFSRLDISNRDAFFFELDGDYMLTPEESMEHFEDREFEDAYLFQVEWTKEEDMEKVDSFVQFILEKCKHFRSIEINGQIGRRDAWIFYNDKTKFGLRVYQKLADAFAQMPNLETVSFYNIRWIPDDEQVAVLFDLFCRNHSISKILLPHTNFHMRKLVRESFQRALDSRPKDKPFIQNRWIIRDFFSERKKTNEWTQTYDLLKAWKEHFNASKKEREPYKKMKKTSQPASSSSTQ